MICASIRSRPADLSDAQSRQDAQALKYQSRCVMIAGRGHCAILSAQFWTESGA